MRIVIEYEVKNDFCHVPLPHSSAKTAPSSSVLTVLNTAPAPPGLVTNPYFRRSLQWVDVLCANEVELAALTPPPKDKEEANQSVDSWEAAEAACDNFFKYAATEESRQHAKPSATIPEWIVATLGAKGCLIARRSRESGVDEKPVRIPSPHLPADGRVVSTVGAGDCFLGAFGYAFARMSVLDADGVRGANAKAYGMERMQKCVECACQAATLSVTKPGVQDSYPTREKLVGVYGENDIAAV